MTICRIVFKNKNGWNGGYYSADTREELEAWAEKKAKGREYAVQDVEDTNLLHVIHYNAAKSIY